MYTFIDILIQYFYIYLGSWGKKYKTEMSNKVDKIFYEEYIFLYRRNICFPLHNSHLHHLPILLNSRLIPIFFYVDLSSIDGVINTVCHSIIILQAIGISVKT